MLENGEESYHDAGGGSNTDLGHRPRRRAGQESNTMFDAGFSNTPGANSRRSRSRKARPLGRPFERAYPSCAKKIKESRTAESRTVPRPVRCACVLRYSSMAAL